MRLDPGPIAAGVRLAKYHEIGSTNAEALSRLRRGERGPLWIVAEKQTAGRGRHRRPWISEPGNLYATLLITAPAPAARAPELAFVAGIAGHDTIVDVAPALQPRLRLKWPNDLLCDGAKLGGILIEGEGTTIAIGIGINCCHHPTETAYPATDLAACGEQVCPDDLMPVLSRTMLERLNQWQGGAGFSAIRREWLARAQGEGSPIRVRIGEREIGGRFDGIDERGRLRLRSADGGLQMISTGEVFLSMPQSAGATD